MVVSEPIRHPNNKAFFPDFHGPAGNKPIIQICLILFVDRKDKLFFFSSLLVFQMKKNLGKISCF
jgi:hypothetical protein